jgi:two-component system, OmpR family, sensor histidine kinase KdpD
MRRFKVHEAVKALLIVSFCALFSIALDRVGVRAENVMMIFLTGVLVVIVETKKLAYGVAASALSVAIFNFFFTAPRYTFAVDDPNYLITFLVFIVVSLIASTLASDLQRQATIARDNERHARLLYEISESRLPRGDGESLARYAAEKLADALSRAVSIELSEKSETAATRFAAAPDAREAQTTVVGAWRSFPLKNNDHSFGTLSVSLERGSLAENEVRIVETVASHVALALDREELRRREELSRMEMERERTRNALLRSISHDLRTPLTSISGSADFIAQSYDALDRETVLSLVADIGSEAAWLHGMVENLLHMTRVQDGKLAMRTSREIVDDLAQEAIARTERLLGGRPVSVTLPDEVLAVDVDSTSIVQVIVNLVGNAVKYADPESPISLAVSKEGGSARFTVSDGGPGFPESVLERPFELREGSKRGAGMGLYICAQIVRAHGGTIEARNNPDGGACVSFALPTAATAEPEETE